MLKILTPFTVVAVDFAGAAALVRSKAPAETEPTAATTPLVRVVAARLDELPLTVSAQGEVDPRTEVELIDQTVEPRDPGSAVERTDHGLAVSFRPGSRFARSKDLYSLLN